MLPRPPLLVQCHHCQGCHWLKDAPEIGEIPDDMRTHGEQKRRWRTLPHVEAASANAIDQALKTGLANSESEEWHARMVAWWRKNDEWREDESISAKASGEEDRANLEEIIRLSPEKEHWGVRTEAVRHLGQFEEAMAMIPSDPGDESFVAELVHSYCLARDSRVHLVQFPESQRSRKEPETARRPTVRCRFRAAEIDSADPASTQLAITHHIQPKSIRNRS